MVLVIDNYDSFTYNLVQLLGALGRELVVRRNDQITLDDIAGLKPSHIVISPGPGHPRAAGVCNSLIQRFYESIPILGVCLGHQCIAHAFGGEVIRAPRMMHGKTSLIYHDGQRLFRTIGNPFTGMRYHSLIVAEPLPEGFEVSARSAEHEIMGIRHREFPVEGIQFHPESIETSEGEQIIKNFLELR